MIDSDASWKLFDTIKSIASSNEQSTNAMATCVRVLSDGTRMMQLVGSSILTPLNGNMAAEISQGDMAEVRIEDGVMSLTANVSNPSVGQSEVNDAVADKATVRQLEDSNARIGQLEVTALTAESATIANLQADTAKVHDLTADQLTAATAYVGALDAGNVTASQLIADHATVGALDSTYAKVDMANVNNAWISSGTIKNGAIVSAMINDVSANKLTAGTINGSVINVTNLNADNITTGTINGQRIGQGSLSLDKLAEDVYTESEVDSKLATMQAEIDGAIETWTGTVVPTLNNSPASGWTTNAVRDTHVGDVYFVVNSQSQQNGYNYRFTKSGSTYSWQLIKDNDVTNALQRLETAEGKITSIESFDSTVSSFMTNTDDELSSVKSRATSLETRMTDAESDISDKVDTSTFNTLSQTVDTNTASITSLSSTVSQKADGSTVTALTNRVSTVEQDVDGIETSIGELQTTVSEKADSSTVTTVSNRLNTISDTVDGHTQTLTSVQNTLSTKADSSTVSTLTTQVNTIEDTVDGHTQTIEGQSTVLTNNGLTSSTNITSRVSSVEQDLSGYKTTVSETYATQTALATTNGNVTAAQTAADNAQTTANTANNKQVAFSATSSTGATTAAKVAACTNFPTLAAGVTVTVRFSTANTSTGAVTLNVNSTGAKTVYVNGAATSSSNQLLWGANANITFTYDGSYWRVDSEPRTWYGTGSVAAATAAKTATINEVVICKGTTVVLNMTYENTSTSATLNVTSTGAKNIYYGTTTTRPTTANGYGWGAGSTVSLTFDGAYWRIGDTTALTRLTAAESTISSHTTSISQNASAIALKADASTTYTKTDVDGLISTEVTNRNAAITAKANEITSTVSQTYTTKQEFADLEVGGRNLLLSSEAERTVSLTSATGTGFYTDYVNESDYGKSLTNGNTTDIFLMSFDWSTTSDDGVAWIQIDGNIVTNVVDGNGGTSDGARGKNYLDLSEGSGRYWVSFRYTSTQAGKTQQRIRIRISGAEISTKPLTAGTTFTASHFKLEKGNKATDWTPAPEDIETRVSSAESAITQNAENIELKVSKDGVISSINQSAESVTINAGKINLNGAVTIGDLASATQDAVLNSNVQVGGRNLLLQSDYGSSLTQNGITFTNNGDGSVTANGEATGLATFWFAPHVTLGSGTYTLSGCPPTGSDSTYRLDVLDVPTSTGVANREDYGEGRTFETVGGTTNAVRLRVASGATVNNVTVYPKLERGNKATDWTPAPEDLQSSAVSRTQRIYYRWNSATAPAAPTSWVTKGDDGSALWTKMHVAITSTHKYIYTCEQYQMADGTLGHTDVLLDNTITVIDGGNIITGSVTANKLNATDINASKTLTVGAMTDAAAATILNSNLQVGGRNLLVGGSTGTNWNYSTFDPASVVYTRSTTATTESYIQAPNMTFEAGETYTLSCWAKSNGNVTSMDIYKVHSSGGGSHQSSRNISLTTEYQKITWTFTCNATTDEVAYVRFDNNGSTTSGTEAILYIKEPKLEKGNVATDWTPAPEDVDNSIANISVGGRNLLLWTGESEVYSAHTDVDRRWTLTTIYGTNVINGNVVTFTKNASGLTNNTSGIRVSSMLASGAAATSANSASLSFGLALTEGDTLTFSCDVKTSGSRVALHAQYYNGTSRWTDAGSITDYGAPVDTDWHRYSHTFTVDSAYVSLTALGVYCELAEGVTISAKNFKLERGNKPTDWSPAPEDVDAAVSDAAKTATNYITADSSGIKIANADPASSTTYQHQTSSGTDFVVNGGVRNRVDSTGMTLYNGSGTADENIVAKFTEALIEIGKNSVDAVIRMCGGMASLTYTTYNKFFNITALRAALRGVSEYGNSEAAYAQVATQFDTSSEGGNNLANLLQTATESTATSAMSATASGASTSSPSASIEVGSGNGTAVINMSAIGGLKLNNSGRLKSYNFGYLDAVTNSNGVTTFNPGMGTTPTAVFVSPAKASSETEAVAKIAVPMVWSIDSATQVQIRWQRSDTNAWLASNRVGCYWLALV